MKIYYTLEVLQIHLNYFKLHLLGGGTCTLVCTMLRSLCGGHRINFGNQFPPSSTTLSKGLNLGCQAWSQGPLPDESSCWLILNYSYLLFVF